MNTRIVHPHSMPNRAEMESGIQQEREWEARKEGEFD